MVPETIPRLCFFPLELRKQFPSRKSFGARGLFVGRLKNLAIDQAELTQCEKVVARTTVTEDVHIRGGYQVRNSSAKNCSVRLRAQIPSGYRSSQAGAHNIMDPKPFHFSDQRPALLEQLQRRNRASRNWLSSHAAVFVVGDVVENSFMTAWGAWSGFKPWS